jgi:hypothetical protein
MIIIIQPNDIEPVENFLRTVLIMFYEHFMVEEVNLNSKLPV